jgi:D-alanyl-D-alanine carboxypeptidase (penicillin-binding protein 5/6)
VRRRPPPRRLHRPRSRLLPGLGVLAVLLVAAAAAWVAAALASGPPTPRLALTIAPVMSEPGRPLTLDPPAGVQEAVAVDGVGIMATGGRPHLDPIASLTKMMSALVVLHDHPLEPGQSGPEITITPGDVTSYLNEQRQGDSVVKVQAGEQLSELQALEASLIPSGDNIIQLLATWDAGSTTAFVAKMNALARSLGLRHTHYAGPSGVDPGNASTATDQLRVGETAMANRVFAKIVAMPQATLPVAGVVYNVNSDLGSDGIDGIKTGWTPAGGASFIFSAPERVDGHRVRIVGDVIGEQGSSPLPTALAAARQLIAESVAALRVIRLAPGRDVATVSAPYSTPLRVVAASSVTLVGWAGARVSIVLIDSRRLASSMRAGTEVGTMTVALGEVRVRTAIETVQALRSPSLAWRLQHP